MPTKIPTKLASPVEDSQCRCPVEGCDLVVDLVIRSSDGKKLGAHTKNMEMFNSAFPAVDSVKHQSEDIVELAEPEDVLKLLLDYSHNSTHMDLRELGAPKLVAFANSAEKYGNFFALDVCKIAMKDVGSRSPEDALPVLIFKAAHSLHEGIDKLASLTMRLESKKIWIATRRVDPKLFYLWCQYRDDWRMAQAKYVAGLAKSCSATELEKKQLSVIRSLSEKATITSRSDIAVIDNAIMVALTVHPNAKGEKFQDVAPTRRWYEGLVDAINGFPRWEVIVRNEALSYGEDTQ